jgi:hypothetical protein
VITNSLQEWNELHQTPLLTPVQTDLLPCAGKVVKASPAPKGDNELDSFQI